MEQWNKPRRGQIYHVTSDVLLNPVGSEIWPDRPGLIISSDALNNTSNCVTVVYLTKSFKKKASPCHIPVNTGKGNAIAQCEQVFSVDKKRLVSFIGDITKTEMSQVESAVALGLGFSENTNPTGIFRKWENYVKRYGIQIADEQKSLCDSILENKVAQTIITKLSTERDSYKNLYDAAIKRLKNIAAIADC